VQLLREGLGVMAFSRIGRPRAVLAMGLAALAAVAMASSAEAGVAFYQGTTGLAAFNAAAGNPGIGIDFEGLSGDITGQTINGVKFINPGSNNTMDVVPAASTFTTDGFVGVIDASTNTLHATSGRNILSPGGAALVPGPDIRQVDTIELIFDTGMPAFGLDVLFQSFDLSPNVFIDVFSATRELGSYIMTGNGAPGGAPGESVFFGVTSTDDPIRGLIISDGDNNNIFPDANLGYDTFRFGPSTPTGGGVPEPATWTMLIAGFGLVGAAARRRRLATA
jgi:hypothetical protein